MTPASVTRTMPPGMPLDSTARQGVTDSNRGENQSAETRVRHGCRNKDVRGLIVAASATPAAGRGSHVATCVLQIRTLRASLPYRLAGSPRPHPATLPSTAGGGSVRDSSRAAGHLRRQGGEDNVRADAGERLHLVELVRDLHRVGASASRGTMPLAATSRSPTAATAATAALTRPFLRRARTVLQLPFDSFTRLPSAARAASGRRKPPPATPRLGRRRAGAGG